MVNKKFAAVILCLIVLTLVFGILFLKETRETTHKGIKQEYLEFKKNISRRKIKVMT